MRELMAKYKNIIFYLIFGVGTTVVNIATYAVCAEMLYFSTVTSNIIAWILAVLFAYVTNKIWVFESKCTEAKAVVRELVKFFGCRLLTGIVDLIIMYVFVDIFSFHGILMKVLSNILVIVLNYVASKLFIFKKSE